MTDSRRRNGRLSATTELVSLRSQVLATFVGGAEHLVDCLVELVGGTPYSDILGAKVCFGMPLWAPNFKKLCRYLSLGCHYPLQTCVVYVPSNAFPSLFIE